MAVFRYMSVPEHHGRATLPDHSGFWLAVLRFHGMRTEARAIRQSALTHLEFVAWLMLLSAGRDAAAGQAVEAGIARALATNPPSFFSTNPQGTQ